MKGPEYLGLGAFAWFFGVVEDRHDPLMVGRVKVRIFGWHPQSKEEMSTQDLPWALTIQPCTSASMSGIGRSPNGLQVGSWVCGFMMDGTDGQFPIIWGTVPGIHKSNSVPNTGADGMPTNAGVSGEDGGNDQNSVGGQQTPDTNMVPRPGSTGAVTVIPLPGFGQYGRPR